MNAYIVADPETREAVVFDAGDEIEVLLQVIESENLEVKFLLNTHGHLDHIYALKEIKDHLGVEFGLHEKDLFLVQSLPQMSAMFGLQPPEIPAVDFHIEEGDTYNVGSLTFEVFYVPGHSPGHVMFYTEGHAFTGDCIFAGSIGRTDLPGGDYKTLIQSIEEKIFTLADDVILHPGHGPETTVKKERESNPFFVGKGNS